MRVFAPILVLVLSLVGFSAAAQDARPFFRVFLKDGTTLVSFGEWVRIDDHLVFSMPLSPDASPSELHLVSIPADRVDLARSERYADTVRAANYAATRGEGDFAQVSASVAQALNQVAALTDPLARLALAESARKSLTDWPGYRHGYRAAEVREIIGVLDGIISGLRASVGHDQSRFDLTLSATTTPAAETLLPAPDQSDVVEQLMAAASLSSTSTEKVSLLHSVISLLDRAVDLLPPSFAAGIRASALGQITEEQRIDASYARLRSATLTEAARYSARADVRTLERLREQMQAEDQKLGGRRPEDMAAIAATLDAHLDAAHRLRLAHDQWLLRVDDLRAYRRSSLSFIRTLARAHDSLDDIRLLAGPAPQTLRPLKLRLSRAARRFALVQPPAELASIHAMLRSAYQLAEQAVQLRLDAVTGAHVGLARQASSAASGALMLLARGRSDLEAALRPPIADDLVSQP